MAARKRTVERSRARITPRTETVVDMAPLPSQEAIVVASRLADLERVIAEGLGTLVAVGRALSEIRDAELYKTTHATFETYCRDRWDMGKSRVYQLIEAVGTVENVHNCGEVPANEAQARELAKVPVADQEAAWVEVVRSAPKGGITARHIKAVVAARLPAGSIRKPTTAGAVKNGNAAFEDLFTLKIHDVWTFKGLDPGFGKKHPGNIPGALVANVLYYFTKPGDLVVDPMAGGGVTGDVCHALGRECVMADLHPHGERTDIAQHKIEDGPVPGTEGKADVVFLDPPYWTLNGDKYGEGSASSKSWAEWLKWLKDLAVAAFKTAKPGGIVCLLMQDNVTKDITNGWSKPSTHCSVYELRRVGFVPVIQIACPLPFSTGGPHDVVWAKENKRLLGINRTLLVFQKPKAKAEG